MTPSQVIQLRANARRACGEAEGARDRSPLVDPWAADADAHGATQSRPAFGNPAPPAYDSPTVARITLCGRFTAKIAGRRIDDALPGPKGRLLFARLAMARAEPLSRDELIGTLWSETAPTYPDRALATLLTRVRSVVGADTLHGRCELTLSLGTHSWVDWAAAESALEQAEAAVLAGSLRVALDIAEGALAITRRTFLPGLSGQWVEDCRRELAARHSALLEVVASSALRLDPAPAHLAERRARELVTREPYRESAHVLLMRAHAARGNVAEALRVYDELRRVLRDELGLTPSQQATGLAESLLTCDRDDNVRPLAM